MTRTVSPVRRSVRFGSARIDYELQYRPRRNLAISVHPDLSIVVVAPEGRTPEQVDAVVHRRAPWILRQQLRFEDLHPLPQAKRFVSGETHRYLGRQVRLRIRRGPEPHVRFERPFLAVTVPRDAGTEEVRRIVTAWFRQRAEVVLARQIEKVLEARPWLHTPGTTFRIRRMMRRWGSCAPSGVISLNPELIHMPPASIEYVIVHELCHRKAMNHGPRFWRLLEQAMPDWAVRRTKLGKTS